MKLNDAIEEFKIDTRIRKAPATSEFYKYYLKMLSRHLGHLDCEKITKRDILEYLEQRKIDNPKVSNATLNKHIITLKAVVKYSTGIKIEFRKFKEFKQKRKLVKKESYEKIFSYFKKHLSNPYSFRNYLFLRLLLDTGLRLSEITNIEVNNINFDIKSITLTQTKTKTERIVCFTESTKELLMKYILTQKMYKYLFTDLKTGKKLTTSAVECMIYRLKNKLNIDHSITPHKWRHTFATNFARKGGEIEHLRMILGHENLKTTQIYLHLDDADLTDYYQKIMERE